MSTLYPRYRAGTPGTQVPANLGTRVPGYPESQSPDLRHTCTQETTARYGALHLPNVLLLAARIRFVFAWDSSSQGFASHRPTVARTHGRRDTRYYKILMCRSALTADCRITQRRPGRK
eukprot:1278858-Rhodomonas_salina.1